ncbi:hypothetical protein ABTX60_36870 [Streptomyces sp. NPDC126510]|uniref:hypothetical protein n=1 Tax=Streptomyces sp. NPDC126510 TaxID=3155317 RepID=UPI00331B883A
MVQATHITLSLLAQRIEQLTGQIDELNQRLTRLVDIMPHSYSYRWVSVRTAPSLS